MLIVNNTSLETLSGLENLSIIRGGLYIGNDNKGGNPVLSNISALQNIDTIGNNLTIVNNNSLSACGIQSVCDYLETHISEISIYNNSEGCNTEEEILMTCPDAVNENKAGSLFTIIPNPAKNEIKILSSNKETINKVVIYSQMGQKVLCKTLVTNKIDISMLNKGIYIIEIVGENISSRQKLLIE